MTAPETRWLDADQQQTWRAFIVSSTLLMDVLDHELRQAHGLSMAEYEILVRLSEAPTKTLRMAQIAESIKHSRSRVTHTVTRMEKAGLIRRVASECDKRGIDAVMTAEGWALLQQAAHTHVTGVRAHFVDVATKSDFAAMGRAMAAVAEHLFTELGDCEGINEG